MKRIDQLMARPSVAHLRRMQERFGQRLGGQFAAAISYFSVLSMVPILMLVFSLLGLTLTVLRPDWLEQVRLAIAAGLSGGDLGGSVTQVIEGALGSWSTIGVIGLATAAWSGAGWVASLKSAVRAQLREDLDRPEVKRGFALELLGNLGILIVLFLVLGGTFAASAVATSLTGAVVTWLGLTGVPGASLLLRLVPVVVNLLAGFALFAFLFLVLPEQRKGKLVRRKAAAAGSIGLALLQVLVSNLIGVFSGNPAAALFGPVIVLMLFFNLFATLVLLLAAWIGTADAPVAAVVPEVEPEVELEPTGMVNEAVARRAMGVGMGTGYVVGAATGIGVGALIAAAAARLPQRRR
ncbi:MAG: YhjD/YihY/BrkB family envelope integrity protein [Micropruina sp.]